MLWNEIVSSICICSSATIFSISLQGQSKLKMLFIQMFASSLYLMSYLFILNVNSAALIGAITAGFEMIRLFVFYFLEKKEELNTRKINLIAMIFFSIILTICTILNWAGWISLLPLFSAVLVSLALGNKNILIIKISFIIQAALITIYLLLLNLWINAASQIFVFIFGIVGLIMLIYKNKRIKKNENTLNKIQG